MAVGRARATLALLLLATAALPSASQYLLGPVTVAVGDLEYDVETRYCRYLDDCAQPIRRSAVFGASKAALAKSIADTVGFLLGYSISSKGIKEGPLVAWKQGFTSGSSGGLKYFSYKWIDSNVSVESAVSIAADARTVAIVSAGRPRPPPSPSPSPSPSPDLNTPLATGFLPGLTTPEISGAHYAIELETCATVTICDAKLRDTAVWNNRELAMQLATAVGTQLGRDAVTGAGPAFVYGADGSGYDAFTTKAGGAQARAMSMATAATVTQVRVPLDSPLTIARVAGLMPPPGPAPLMSGFKPDLAFPEISSSRYAVEMQTCNTDFGPCGGELRKSPFWGRPELARELAREVGTQLGRDDATGAGPAFVHDVIGDDYLAYVLKNGNLGELRAPRALPVSVARVAALPPPSTPTPLASGFVPEPEVIGRREVEYSVQPATCHTLFTCDDKLRESPVWGKLELARDLARVVGAKLGSDDESGAGPAFVYGADERGYTAFGARNGSVTAFRASRVDRLTFARAEMRPAQVRHCCLSCVQATAAATVYVRILSLQTTCCLAAQARTLDERRLGRNDACSMHASQQPVASHH